MAEVVKPLTRQDKIEMVASAAGVEGSRAIYALEKNGSPATHRIPCRKTVSKAQTTLNIDASSPVAQVISEPEPKGCLLAFFITLLLSVREVLFGPKIMSASA